MNDGAWDAPKVSPIQNLRILAQDVANLAEQQGQVLTIAQRVNPDTAKHETSIWIEPAVTDIAELQAALALSMEVTHEKSPQKGIAGIVTLSFNQPIALLTLDADQAIQLAQLLVDNAKLADFAKGHTFNI